MGEVRKIEIMDTTLRDGEQTSGVSFAAQEKVSVVRLLLEELKVDRVEIASARVSEGEYKSVQKIAQWATTHGYIDRLEVLGFVDGNTSLEWIAKTGCKVVNLLSKGSLKHCTYQLRKTPDEHLKDIKNCIASKCHGTVCLSGGLVQWYARLKRVCLPHDGRTQRSAN